MQQFEFMRNVTFGQYLPTGSLIHRLDPRTRLAAMTLVLLSITLAPHAGGLVLSLVLVMLVYWLARIPLKYALKSLLPPLPFLAIILGIQIFFFHPAIQSQPIFMWGIIHIYLQNLQAAGVLFLRFSSLILGISLMTFVLSTNEMVRGLEGLLKPLRRLKVPIHDLVFMVQVTLRFLPLLAQTAERVAKAQAARGANWDGRRLQPIKNARRIIPVIVPIFLISLNRAEHLALAMDARAYDSFSERTSMVEFHPGVADAVFAAASITATVLIFVL
jgi:energy-coupling factor transport system permease protein